MLHLPVPMPAPPRWCPSPAHVDVALRRCFDALHAWTDHRAATGACWDGPARSVHLPMHRFVAAFLQTPAAAARLCSASVRTLLLGRSDGVGVGPYGSAAAAQFAMAVPNRMAAALYIFAQKSRRACGRAMVTLQSTKRITTAIHRSA